jgi:acyl carrier protein
MSESYAVVQNALVELGVPREEIAPTACLRDDLAVDSTEQIELISILEKQLGANLDEKQLKKVRTVAELVSFVDSYR